MAPAAVTSEGVVGDIGGTLVALPPWFAREDLCAAASSSRESWPLASESSCSKAARISCRDSCLGKAATAFAGCACDASLTWPGLTAMAQMPRTPSSISTSAAAFVSQSLVQAPCESRHVAFRDSRSFVSGPSRPDTHPMVCLSLKSGFQKKKCSRLPSDTFQSYM